MNSVASEAGLRLRFMDRKIKQVDHAFEVHRKTPRMTFASLARTKRCDPFLLAGGAASALLALCLLFPSAVPAEDASPADEKAASEKDSKKDPGAKTEEEEKEKEGEKEKKETKPARSPLTDAIKRLSGKGAKPDVSAPAAGAEAAAPARS